MATTNNNRPLDMKQLWQQMEPAPVASSALSALTTSEDGLDRFIYYISGAAFYRYDTYGNAWQKLAPPPLAPTVFASMRFSKFSGSFGRIITATASGARIPGVAAGVYTGYKIRIMSGKGAGQVRTITACPEPVVYDQGVATAATALIIGDSTKRWRYNQWDGYQVRLTYSSGVTQVRKILYSDNNTVYVSDVNYAPIDPFNNAPFSSIPGVTAGSQTHFVIEATDVTVDVPWTIVPDGTSRFKIESGGVWLLTSNISSPFASLQYYDIAADYWVTKTVPPGFFMAAFGTDGSLERTGEIGGIYKAGTATAATTYTLSDSAQTMTKGQYANFRIRITGGKGVGQTRRVLTNGVNYFEVPLGWDTVPDTTSTYEVIADKDKMYIAGNAQTFLLQYDVNSDLIIQGSKYDDGIANVMAARYPGVDTPTIAITSGARSVSGISTFTIAVAGTGYVVGDILTLATGVAGKVMVESVNAAGGVLTATLVRPGVSYSGTPTCTTTPLAGLGTGCTITVTGVATYCHIETAINHRFQIGDFVILSGDPLYAGQVQVVGVDLGGGALLGFDIATSAVGNMTASGTLSPTLLVDSTKNWVPGEHVGKMVQCHLTGIASGTVTPRVITANTATTLSFPTITTAPVNGTGRYIITDQAALGRDDQFKRADKGSSGFATGGSTTTLIDSTKNWGVNQWANAKLRIKAGTGRDAYVTVTSNTATTLTYPAYAVVPYVSGFTPDATTSYYIQDSYGVVTLGGTTTTITDTTKNWTLNQWAGKRVRVTGGTGFNQVAVCANEILIVSNTATVLTFTTLAGFSTGTDTSYTIVGIAPRSTGIELLWACGGSSGGQYMYCARGGGLSYFDRYDVVGEEWDYPLFLAPQTDTLTSGAYYAYDGKDKIYFSPAVAAGLVQYVYYFDIRDGKVVCFGSVPNTQSTNVVGNRMEIVTSPWGISYLYHMRNTAAEMYRAQIFF